MKENHKKNQQGNKITRVCVDEKKTTNYINYREE